MLQKIRTFLNKEKLYAWMLIIGLFMQSFFIAFERPENVSSPAMEQIKAAQENFKNTEDKKQLFSELVTEDFQAALIFLSAVLFTLMLIGAGFILGIICLIRKLQGKAMIRRVCEACSMPWGVAEISKIAILFYFWSIVTGILFGIINEFIFSCAYENLVILIHTFMMDSAVLFFIIYFVIVKYKKPLGSIGLNYKNLVGDMFLGFSSYCVVLPLLILIIAGLGALVNMIHYEPPPHPLVDIFVVEDRRSPFIIYLSLILACTIGPFIEEVFFRGFCYTGLKKHIGIKGAMIVTAAFFAFIHYSAFAFIPIFVLGLALAYLYEKRGTLIPSITLHVVHNALFIGYFFMVKRIILDKL